MQQFTVMLQLQLQLFTLLGIGCFLGKKKWLTGEGRQCITDIFIKVILPCNIFVSFQVQFTKEIMEKIFDILIISFAIQFFCLFLSKVLYQRSENGRKSVLQYATICSNSGFMGNPVVEGAYGSMGLLYASVALIPLRIFMWSAGLSLFTVASRKKVIRQLLTHPCIIAVEAGLLFMMTGWTLPQFLQKTVSGLGACVTPISMLIIGSILSEVKPTAVFDRELFRYTIIRLLLIPCAVMLVLKALRFDSLLIGVSVLLSGMPAGSTTAILAEKYDGDAEFASKCVLVSTLLSVITLPVLCLSLS